MAARYVDAPATLLPGTGSLKPLTAVVHRRSLIAVVHRKSLGAQTTAAKAAYIKEDPCQEQTLPFRAVSLLSHKTEKRYCAPLPVFT